MIWKIAKNEFLQSFQGNKLTIAMLVCCTMMPLSVFIMLLDYDQRYENFTINRSNEFPRSDSFVIPVGQHSNVVNDFPYPDKGKIKRPGKLSIFVKGTDDALSGTFILDERWLDPVFGVKQERNVFASLFGSFDLLLVTKLAVGLLAVILGCGSVVSEREAGTLALILTNRIGRAQLIIGKFAGGIFIVSASYITGLILCLILLIAWPSWGLTTADLVPITLIFITFIIYVIFSYLLGMTISSLCRTSATASIAAVGIWLLIIVLLPMLLLHCGEIAHSVPTSELLKFEKIEAGRAILDQAKSNLSGPQGYDFHFGFPNYVGPHNSRVEYKIAEAIGAIEQKHLQSERKQINLANFLQMLTPSGALTNIVGDLAGTSIRSYLLYRWATIRLRNELYNQEYPTIDQLLAVSRGHLDPKLFLWNTYPDPNYLSSLNLEEKAKNILANPVFDHSSRPWRTGGRDEYDLPIEYEKYIKEESSPGIFSVADFLSLLLATFLCFGLTFCLMMKYDVRPM